jgi:hypothetical protein
VQISTTSTGVYSSDAMTSAYVRYPGIHVTHAARAADTDSSADSLAFWTPRRGWVPSPALTAGSFVAVTPLPGGGAVVRSNDTLCVLTYLVASC